MTIKPVYLALLAGLFTLQAMAQSYSTGFVEKGKASYYGKKYHGRTTASGERFNMHAMTAAHRYMPFNTVVKVTSKTNGKSVILRITDRGPFVKGRIIDLSKGAAKKLGMLQDGVVPVEAEVLQTPEEYARNKEKYENSPSSAGNGMQVVLASNPGRESAATTANSGYITPAGRKIQPRGYGIQLGAWSDYQKAFNAALLASKKGLRKVCLQPVQVNGKQAWRLLWEETRSTKELRNLLKTARKKGYKEAFTRKY